MLVGANMSGCEKLPLLVIGKSASPRCFKKANIPLEYTANKKAWMRCKFLGHFNVFNHRLADIFGNWLKNGTKSSSLKGAAFFYMSTMSAAILQTSICEILLFNTFHRTPLQTVK